MPTPRKKLTMTPVFVRVLWHLNRTPLRWAVKSSLNAVHWREKRERRRFGRAVDGDDLSARARDFEEQGYAVVDDLVDPSLLSAMAIDGADKLARADELERHQRQTHKGFWVSMLDQETTEAFRTDSVYVRFALQPRIVELVSTILGELPVLSYVLLTLSRPDASELSISQLWHRDHDDVRVIKLFTYLTDVLDDGDGPFTFMPRQASKAVKFTLHSHVPDERIFTRLDPAAVRAMKAPRLTTFVVETSRCFHMGSRLSPGHRRLMYTATFLTAPSMFPRNAPPFSLVDAADRRTRLLLGQPD